MKAWLKHLKDAAPSSERPNLQQLLAGPFATLKLIKTEARISLDDVPSATAWVDRAMKLAYTSPISGATIKPFRRLRVLINPAGGPGKSRALYETRIRPTLEAAGCKLSATFTTHRNHGLDIVRDEADLPDAYDAIVCVSGDGMIHEVLNGLSTRPKDAKRALKKIPVVPIPTGSGNATSVCLLGPEQGFNLAHACLNAIKGSPLPLDICTVTQRTSTSAAQSGESNTISAGAAKAQPTTNGSATNDPQSTSPLPYVRYYSFLSQAIGLMADVDIGTEHLRALGDSRFIIGFLGGIVSNNQARVTIDVKLGSKGTKNRAEMRQRRAETRGKAQADSEEAQAVESQLGAEEEEDAMPALQHGAVTDELGDRELPEFDMVDPSWRKSDLFDSKKLSNGTSSSATPSPDLSASGGWARIPQPIATLYAGKLPYVARDLLQFPYATPGDGTIDVCTLLHSGGRLAKLRTIGGAETGAAIYDKAVSYLKVEAYRVTPQLPPGHKRLKGGGLISIDGEQVPYEPFQVEVTPGLQMKVLSLFGDFVAPQVEPPETHVEKKPKVGH